MDDGDLIRSYKEGSEEAFEEVVRKYAAPLYRFSYRLLLDRALADDCVQESFVKAWKSLGRFDESSRGLRPWLYAIARNTAIDLMRKRKSIPLSALDPDGDAVVDIPGADEPLDEAFSRKEASEAIEEALAALPMGRRAVILMHDVDGMTFEEIAAALGKPMNTVKSHYRRSMAALREALSGKGPFDDAPKRGAGS